MIKSSRESGLTTVELIITLFTVAAFITIFYQLYLIIDKIASDGYQRSIASNLAYSNLRMYATTEPPSWFTCDSSTDTKNNPSAPGQILLSGNTTAELPGPITQSVIATAPYGCGVVGQNMPVKVESSITYGPENTTLTHTTYAGF